MRADNPVVAVLVSDLHLSSRVPLARSVEEDWWAVQRGYLGQLAEIAKEHQAPIICGGDIVDRWNDNNELVNFLLDWMPALYSVAGQHDLPNHRLAAVHRSAYGTLVRANRVHHIPPAGLSVHGVALHGFSWGVPVTDCPRRHSLDNHVRLAVCHCYTWIRGASYPNAPPEQRLKQLLKCLRGYDAVLIGDNHSSWGWNLSREREGPAVLNPGSFLRRKADERSHRPCVGLLHADGSISREFLDTSGDVFLDVLEGGEGDAVLDADEFLGELSRLGDCVLSFREAVTRAMDKGKVSEGVRAAVLAALEGGK